MARPFSVYEIQLNHEYYLNNKQYYHTTQQILKMINNYIHARPKVDQQFTGVAWC